MTLKTNFIRNLQQQKWYIINDQNNGNENELTIKFEAKAIKPNLCDYSDAYIFVTGDITKVTFSRWVAYINEEHV